MLAPPPRSAAERFTLYCSLMDQAQNLGEGNVVPESILDGVEDKLQLLLNSGCLQAKERGLIETVLKSLQLMHAQAGPRIRL